MKKRFQILVAEDELVVRRSKELREAVGQGLAREQPDERLLLRLESNGSNPPQARASQLLKANKMVAVHGQNDLRPPLRWGLNE